MPRSPRGASSYRTFYEQLFARLEAMCGALDPETVFAIAGFDGGGPLNFCTIGSRSGDPFVTYVSCELAPREEQQPSPAGRYELLTTCDEEHWVRSVLSGIGRMSLEVSFGDGHTLDIGAWVAGSEPIQGVLFEQVYATEVDATPYAVLRVIGITRAEMDYARERGAEALIRALEHAGVYPRTIVSRPPVL